MRLRWLPVLALLLETACAPGLLVSPAQEVQIGQGVDEQIEQQFRIVADGDPVDEWAEQLLQPLVRASDRFRSADEIGGYEVEVIADDKVINAFAAPGGFVYLTTGLILAANSCAEIAGVLGHELAHVTQRHSVQQIERAFAAQTLAGFFLEQGLAQDAALTIFSFLQQTTFSREHEREADAVGLQIAYQAGYNPYGLADFFELLLEQERGGGRVPAFLSSHPATDERIRDVRQQIQAMYGDRVQPGRTQSYECLGTHLTLAQVQERIRSGQLEIRRGTGTRPAQARR